MDLCELTLAVEKIARQAGAEIKRCYDAGQYESYTKGDESPVTSADYAANDIICAELLKLAPTIPIVSEESKPEAIANRQQWSRYWLIDPLDGTQEFVAGSGDFTTVIALIENNIPVIGVIYAPIHDRCYLASLGKGAFKREGNELIPIKVNDNANEGISIAVSLRQSKETVLSRVSADYEYRLVPMGSATLKAGLVAEGGADIYMRVGPTGEWDTGAAHCILTEAGGDITDLSLNRLTYNLRDTLANPNFVVTGHQSFPWSKIIIAEDK
ncbi:3'(2'),5'-bisphosphate nucleotidase CysQ [Psychrobium sp. 1_MG-2023]|uniref:3'(2'),5'-bisphosphate nucleotidase CysQ n=1 Tax=Psychrobium sp. 1_MG-2023 TaxID=3062624 RepID=UPI000C33E214|nr:3'(2'),5'-bisphosphate nucleotidase CysQ [Psychrobium sp. 1_MG-2023]MDP2561943.1 3'(2'),5'-bisphosphate nucleotidase CysQ [Psychrobium sp. 1_MG-2023]PKF58674.1 3'(2'),5'-bisphosphate nucleotidase [Alteromonadales bacterium alter-6D02]